MNRESIFALSLNPKNYESTTHKGWDEEFPVNRKSNFPPTPNPKDFESTIDEAGDE